MKLTKVESKMAKIQKIDLKSKDIKSEQVERLKAIFPEAVADGKINFEQLKATVGEDIEDSKERFGMTWAGKSKCFRIIQDPATGTLKPCQKDSINFDSTKNLFIEGDNLEVLKLLQKSYYEKVKMIYIDPPYNTGNEFVYNDSFGQQLNEYLKITGQTDTDGKKLSTNTDSSGRYHSNWMNMMYPRLFLARNLLQEEGVIFISIDDNEIDNLKKICNEIFGEENFLECIIWKKRATPPNDRNIGRIHEFILCYAKNKEKVSLGLLPRDEKSISRYSNPDNDERGNWAASDLSANGKGGRLVASCVYPIKNPKTGDEHMPSEGRCWLFNKDKMNDYLKEGRVDFRQKTGAPFLKRYISEVRQGLTLPTILTEMGFSSTSATELDKLFTKKGVFEYAKPTTLIKPLIKIGTADQKDALVLDFFAGSGTTAHAIIELNKEDNSNRKFICVQLPETTDEKSEAFKEGYKTIAEISKERIRRIIKRIVEENKNSQKTLTEEKLIKQDLGFKVFKLDKSNFKIWDNQTEELQTSLTEHVEQIKKTANSEEVLYEILLKDGFELTTEVKTTKLGNKEVFSVENNLLLICLDEKLDLNLFKEMKKLNPHVVIVLDKGFKDNDQLKTNAVQTLGKNSDEEYILRSI
jgi:adenine-specific DNA-methyltransferase